MTGKVCWYKNMIISNLIMNKQVLNAQEFLAKEIDIGFIMLHAIHKSLEKWLSDC